MIYQSLVELLHQNDEVYSLYLAEGGDRLNIPVGYSTQLDLYDYALDVLDDKQALYVCHGPKTICIYERHGRNLEVKAY